MRTISRRSVTEATGSIERIARLRKRYSGADAKPPIGSIEPLSFDCVSLRCRLSEPLWNRYAPFKCCPGGTTPAPCVVCPNSLPTHGSRWWWGTFGSAHEPQSLTAYLLHNGSASKWKQRLKPLGVGAMKSNLLVVSI